MREVAEAVKGAGARILRGGAYKPRTSPYAFQGLKEQGLHYLAEARKRTGLPFVTEVLETESVELVAEHADMLQIGARNVRTSRCSAASGRQPRAVGRHAPASRSSCSRRNTSCRRAIRT
jgi:3-deoxy-7-phosphoheptulonate synthase